MTKFRRTQEEKLKRIVDLHLQYAERQKKILEANITRHNYLHTIEQRKQQQHRTNYQNEYDRIRAYLQKKTHTALHPVSKDITTRKDELKTSMANTFKTNN